MSHAQAFFSRSRHSFILSSSFRSYVGFPGTRTNIVSSVVWPLGSHESGTEHLQRSSHACGVTGGVCHRSCRTCKRMEDKKQEMKSVTPSRLSHLVNIGHLTARLLIEVEVPTAQELRSIWPVVAWRRIQARYPSLQHLGHRYHLVIHLF